MSRAQSFKGKASAALAVLIVGSGFFADFTMAASANSKARLIPVQGVVVIVNGQRQFWPLYSASCVYKGVMTNEDMYRCGVFPPGTVVYVISDGEPGTMVSGAGYVRSEPRQTRN